MSVTEQSHTHLVFNPNGLLNSPSPPPNTLMWRCNNLSSSSSYISNGRETTFGANSFTINITGGIPSFRTIAHELGHAKYGLGHPDDDYQTD